MKLSVVIVSRNDNYGGYLNERATYAINSAIESFDEVYYVDWNSEGPSLLHAIQGNLQLAGNLNHIVVPPDLASELTKHDPHAQKCCEVLARNIGIRRATGDYIVSTNIDVIQPKREDILNLIYESDGRTFITIRRRDIERDLITDFHGGGYDYANWRAFRDHAYTCVEPKGEGEIVYTQGDASVIPWCGDFQLASREIWHEIRGFEEELIYPLYADSNVQKKAIEHGFGLKAVFTTPIFHINHGTEGFGEGGYRDGINKKKNDINAAITNAGKTKNSDEWGFNSLGLPIEVL